MAKFSFEKLRGAEFVVVLTVVAFVVTSVVASIIVGIDDVLHNIALVNPVVIAGMLVLSLINYGARSYRWHVFSRHLGINIPFFRSLIFYFAGFSMTTTPAKLGEVLRCWLIERCHRYGYHRVTPLFIGDRLSDVGAMAVLCVIGLLGFSQYRFIAIVTVLLLLLVITLFIWPRGLIGLVGMVYKVSGRHRRRMFVKARRALRLTADLFGPRIFAVTTAIALIGWFAECLAFYWLLRELGTPVTILQASFVFCFSMIAGALTMMPGGLGGVEAAMITLLAILDVDLGAAITATAIIRLTSLWFAVILGFVTLPVAMRIARNSVSVVTQSDNHGLE